MSEQNHKKSGIVAMSLGALGIVYGDIGTSPLYSMKEMFFGHSPLAITNSSVYGAISLIFWALTIVITFKYIFLVLRADNDGQGGVFALLGQLLDFKKINHKIKASLTLLLVLGAGMVFGDGIITPAISVLSAVEGLAVLNSGFAKFVIPITIVILTLLFMVQRKGTAGIGKAFGPIVLLWFIANALIGASYILKEPAILQSVNPLYAIRFLGELGLSHTLVLLGSLMLVVTGGEALFADMGHFGSKPIRLSWFSVVYPSLLLAYFGQGAFLLSGATIKDQNIFFSMVPHLLLVPMVILATMATVIASQALISGAFSLTIQGIATKYMPRMKVIYTSHDHEGQVYVPTINWALYVGCIVLVLTFKSSTNLASAYGLAVAFDMVVTALLLYLIARKRWGWNMLKTALVITPLLMIDLAFLVSNSLKLFQGGYVPLVVGLALCLLMTTWAWGRKHVASSRDLNERIKTKDMMMIWKNTQHYSPKSILILSARPIDSGDDPVPIVLQKFYDRFRVLPRHIIILCVKQTRKAIVDIENRYEVRELEQDPNRSFISIVANFGYMEAPDVKSVIKDIAKNKKLTASDDMKDWIILAGKERIVANKQTSRQKPITKIRSKLYGIISRNTAPAYEYFGLSSDLRLMVEPIPVKIK
jgi:KUP system potassium uptake protein